MIPGLRPAAPARRLLSLLLRCSIRADVSAPRRTLTLRLSPTPSGGGVRPDVDADLLLRQALSDTRMIAARYNKGRLVLQPLLLFEEHDLLFLVASAVSRDGRRVAEQRYGIYRLAGLSDLSLLGEMADQALPEESVWKTRPGRRLVAALGDRADTDK